MSLEFSIKTFDELTSVDIYHILKARAQVFVVEQKCAYQDMDEVDFDCLHVVAHDNEALVGYCRIIPPEFNQMRSNLLVMDGSISTSSMSAIGRVLVLAPFRGQGVARQIMVQAIKHCHKKFGKKKPIIIAAQSYLTRFYESLGFVPEGDVYLIDDIEHVKMILSIVKKVKVPKQHTDGATTTTKVLGFLLFMMGGAFILGLLYLMT